MPEPIDFAPYRAQMTANDLAHQAFMVLVILMMFYMAHCAIPRMTLAMRLGSTFELP